jgi:D-cysteine desulfhydrase
MAVQFLEMGFTPDYIVVASGSGGTQAGLIIGKKLFGLSSQIVGINVRCDEAYFHHEIGRILDEFRALYRVDVQAGERDVRVIDGYVGAGYGQSQPEELRFIAQAAKSEALLVDTTYTGKALYGLAQEIKKGTFKQGEKVLFIHTGGLFGFLHRGAEFSEAVFRQD